MKTALYPGTFNPWHQGHADVLTKALQVFDAVVITALWNPDKGDGRHADLTLLHTHADFNSGRVTIHTVETPGLLVDLVRETKVDALVRGLRNGHDLQYEMNQQYWNEDLGLTVPVVYFICDRKLGHISSSAIRVVQKFQKPAGRS